MAASGNLDGRADMRGLRCVRASADRGFHDAAMVAQATESGQRIAALLRIPRLGAVRDAEAGPPGRTPCGILRGRMPPAASSTTPARLVRAQVAIESFAIAPDGESLVHARRIVVRDRYRSHLVTVAWRGGRARQLTHGAVRDANPAFSPDGRSLAFLRTFVIEPRCRGAERRGRGAAGVDPATRGRRGVAADAAPVRSVGSRMEPGWEPPRDRRPGGRASVHCRARDRWRRATGAAHHPSRLPQ